MRIYGFFINNEKLINFETPIPLCNSLKIFRHKKFKLPPIQALRNSF